MLTIKPGATFHAKPPIGGYADVYKVHVVQVIDEGRDVINENDPVRIQIVYRVFGKRKQWWHYYICTRMEFESYVDAAGKEQINRQ